MRWFAVFLSTLVLACSPARATPDCRQLTERRDLSPTLNFLLVFLNLNTAEMKEADRLQLRLQLEDRINPQLAEYVRKLWQRNGAKPRDVELIACDTPVGSSDLGTEDLQILKRYNVIAAVWRSVDGLTYLTFPFYRSQPNLGRRQAEVVLGYRSSAADPAAVWAELLQQSQRAREAFVALALALVLIEKQEPVPAWVTLCESRRALAIAADDAVRPPRADLVARMGGIIDGEIEKLAGELRGKTPPDRFKPPAVVQKYCSQAIDLSAPAGVAGATP
jgi:hypothetical protein